jgi:colanic acid/amylovoran biosynthesis glycosyltransferase
LAASYCTFFLKREMQHIYRQITSLQAFESFVITKYRQNEDVYPYPDIEILPEEKTAPLRRAYRKYVRREPPLLYRGEFDTTRRILIRRDPDLMHVYFGNTGVHLLPLLEAWDRPAVVSFHGVDVQTRPKERRYLTRLRRLFRVCRLALVRSGSLRDRLVEIGCDPDKIRLNQTGIPLEEFSLVNREPAIDGAWRLIQASRFIDKKGLPTTLLAFAIFRQKYPVARLFLAGEGPMRDQLETMVSELDLGHQVVFTGFLQQPELRKLFASCHLFLHPSETTPEQDQEGIPNAMLEAMATGLPVVATRHGGIPEAITEGMDGYLVAERDHVALGGALLKLVGDCDRWREMGRAASRSVAAKFDRAQQIKALEDCYFEALDSPRRTVVHHGEH